MAATDLLTDDEARSFVSIGLADNKKSTVLSAYVTACSDRIAKACGPVVYGTLTETYDGGHPTIYLRSSPVHSVVSVVEYDDTTAGTLTAETNALKPAEGYNVDPVNGKLTRRDLNRDVRFPVGTGNIVVSYVAGRCADTDSVPERFKVACGIMLQAMWRGQESSAAQVGEFDVPQANFPKFAIPNAVKELLGDEWRTGSGIGD